jgi:hypothetical protein
MTATIESEASSLHIFDDLIQGEPEWLQARCGIPTASVIGQFITLGSPDALAVDCSRCGEPSGNKCISTSRKVPTPIKTPHDERTHAANHLPPVFKVSSTDYSRALTLALVAERITGYVDPIQTNRDMERGTLDEPYARDVYSERYAPAHEVGFMVRDFGWGRIGYSPDGLVGDDGLIEIKSPRQKKHLATILADEVPIEHMAQIQTGLLVSGRAWLDFMSYNGGMPPFVKRVHPDPLWQAAIIEAAREFENTAAVMIGNYRLATAGQEPTERINHFPDMELNF